VCAAAIADAKFTNAKFTNANMQILQPQAAIARLEEERVTSLQYQLYIQRSAAESQKQEGTR
jgi:hypothetical protein